MVNIKQYLTEVKTELKRVSWSSRDDLIASTVAVIASVAFLAVFIGIADFFISRLINVIIR